MKPIWCFLSVILWINEGMTINRVQAQETVTVDVVRPETETQRNTLQLTGSIEAIQDTNLAVQQSGAVLALFVDEGARVRKGDKLLQLDASIASYRLSEMQALLSVSEIEYQEAKRLYQEVLALSKTQVVAETLIAERKAAVARANGAQIRQQAAVDLQKEILQRFTLLAPFDGVISARNADVGEWVTPQQWVFNLVSNAGLRLRIAIPQEYFSSFRESTVMASITPDNNRGAELQLPVENVVAVSDLETRTITALINLPQPENAVSENLISGMSARVTLNFGEQQNNLIWLPQSAVKAHPDGGSSVFAVENGKAKRFVVTLGEKKRMGTERDEHVAVMGADASLHYVVKGVELLQHGQSVTVSTQKGAN